MSSSPAFVLEICGAINRNPLPSFRSLVDSLPVVRYHKLYFTSYKMRFLFHTSISVSISICLLCHIFVSVYLALDNAQGSPPLYLPALSKQPNPARYPVPPFVFLTYPVVCVPY